MSKGPRVVAERVAFSRNNVALLLLEDRGGRRFAPRPLELVEVPEGESAEPTVTLSATAAQELMDDLWRCGLRPSEGAGSAGALAATERHLADMRAIALGLLAPHGVEPRKR